MTDLIEQWLSVVGFEGLYEVSSFGRVKGRKGIVSPYANKKGHLRVNLYKHNIRSKRYVHRLVLEAFVGPCPDGMECCHGDGKPSNNRISNLRWDTPAANWADMRRHGTACIRDTHPLSKLTSADIVKIRSLRARGLLHREIAPLFNVCAGSISYVLRRRP